MLKPNVVLYGEMLPEQTFWLARQATEQCDVMIVAGSSLEVTPAADIPFVAAAKGARSIVVNLEPTDFDQRADLVIHGDVAQILPQIVDVLNRFPISSPPNSAN